MKYPGLTRGFCGSIFTAGIRSQTSRKKMQALANYWDGGFWLLMFGVRQGSPLSSQSLQNFFTAKWWGAGF